MLLIVVRQHISLIYATLASVDPLWVWSMSVSSCYEENENVPTNPGSCSDTVFCKEAHVCINIVKHSNRHGHSNTVNVCQRLLRGK